MRLSVSEIAHAVRGRVVGPDLMVDGASYDSRETLPGQLFVPAIGERDGHDFVDAAIAKGAPVYLSSKGPLTEAATCIEVADTEVAFMALGSLARTKLPDRVVGVTGSVGKTSVKDLADAAFRTHYRTKANPRSLNNELGLPQTLCNAPDGTEAVIVEMGMRGLGEITRLCEVARPTVGIVTIIGEAHTGRLGGLAGVAQAKGELVEALPTSGFAILNADQDICFALRNRTSASVLSFGTTSGDVRADVIVLNDLAQASFTLRTPWGDAPVQLGLSGVHMAANAAAAAAAALACGVPLERVVEGLATASLSPWRMDVRRAPSGLIVINDAYNANPTSMTAALDALAALPVTGRRVAVLGLMAELDEDGPARHRAMAEHARVLGIEVVAVATTDYGIGPADDPMATVATLGSGDAVLFKGSRVAGLETLAQQVLHSGEPAL
jgi:UDP-N-acetylmuramoyl-tripeptide--D-alanyl-D-alanine ligase